MLGHCLPIFVILPGQRRGSERCIQIGWIEDWDDGTKQFLILFGTSRPQYQPAPEPSAPFVLTDNATPKFTRAKVRGRSTKVSLPGAGEIRMQVCGLPY
jgi:hypothetical protein